MRPRTRRSVRRAAAGLIGALALTGCAGLPSSSPVGVGKPVSAGRGQDPLTVLPDGPLPGDGPQQIALGFLRAQMVDSGGRALARSFLTPGAGTTWHPTDEATVFADTAALTVTRPDISTVRVRIPVIAHLAADGHLVRTAEPEMRTLDFQTQHAAAGWRLARVPEGLGLWLSQGDLARLYQRSTVYYPSASGRVMVPDVRWLPRQGLATALARAALSAPPSWLAPAVHVPFPAGTSLDVESVPVSASGTATIDLSSAPQHADASDRMAMWASLTATVAQDPEVMSVTVSSRGSRLEAENLPASVQNVSDLGYQMPSGAPGSVIVRRGSQLTWTDPASASTLDARSGSGRQAARPNLPSVPGNWARFTAGPGGRQIAAVSRDGRTVRRWVNGAQNTLSDLGSDLSAPSFDAPGFLWCAGRRAGGADGGDTASDSSPKPVVWALSRGNDWDDAQPLTVPWLTSGTVRAMSISPEGARVALLVEDGSSRGLLVAAVVRAPDGTPTALGAPLELRAPGEVHDVAWLDDSSLALLPTGKGAPVPMTLSLDGEVDRLGSLPKAAFLVSSRGGASGLYAATSAGAVYNRLGAGWSLFVNDGEIIVPSS